MCRARVAPQAARETDAPLAAVHVRPGPPRPKAPFTLPRRAGAAGGVLVIKVN